MQLLRFNSNLRKSIQGLLQERGKTKRNSNYVWMKLILVGALYKKKDQGSKMRALNTGTSEGSFAKIKISSSSSGSFLN